MLKHIGRHGDQKVVIAYNEVPGEDHMALVVYTEKLPDTLAHTLMQVVQSEIGQQEKVLAEALHRSLTNDGQNLLQTIHRGGWLKKVQCKQVILTPNANTNVRLDELNKILKEMAKGSDAIEKMRKLDAGRGFADPGDGGREVGEPARPITAGTESGVLSDADIATSLTEQANGMRAQIKVLQEEAVRLEAEATALMPKTKTKKATVKATVTKPKAKNGSATKKTTKA